VLASAAFEPDHRERLGKATRASGALVTAAIRDGIDDGSIAPAADPDTTAQRLTAVVDCLSVRWPALDDPRPRP
jgi:hypothetical protein